VNIEPPNKRAPLKLRLIKTGGKYINKNVDYSILWIFVKATAVALIVWGVLMLIESIIIAR